MVILGIIGVVVILSVLLINVLDVQVIPKWLYYLWVIDLFLQMFALQNIYNFIFAVIVGAIIVTYHINKDINYIQ